LLGQNAVNLTTECCAMHFGFELPGGPSLEKTGGHAITDFEFGHGRTDCHNFSGSVRKRYPTLDRLTIILPAKDNQVAIIERSRLDPENNLMIARFRNSPVNKL
jgi:hypothetical protein